MVTLVQAIQISIYRMWIFHGYLFVFLLQAEVLQNVYNDCTRLDDALKRGESLLKEETPDNTTTANIVTKINDYAQSNVSSSQTTYSDYWNNYYSTQADDYSSVGGSSQYDSTHEPYGETSEPVDEPIVQETTTS